MATPNLGLNSIFLFSTAALISASFAPFAVAQSGQSAVWNLDGTRLTTNLVGTTMNGNYVDDNGRITGTLNGNVLDGYWGEDSSGSRCSTQRLGTYYWGRIHWEFHATGFRGLWGYCEANPSSNWTGTLISGSSPVGHHHDTSVSDGAKQSGTSVWNFDGTRLTLRIDGNSVNGNYVEDNGRISGTMLGNTMNGYWGEDSSARRCDTQRLGTFYWGRTRFVFDGARFSGLWSYCDAEPTTSWSGTLISGNSPFGQHQDGENLDGAKHSASTIAGLGGHLHVWNTSEGRLTAAVQNTTFSGNYDNDNGRVSGTVSGNVVDGYWGEDSSGKRCSVERLGTYYWGRIRWTFNNTGFTGQYSYCDDPYSGSWNGTLVP